MTETEVQKVLLSIFNGIGEPLLTLAEENGKTVITNVSYPNKAFTRPKNGYWFEIYFLSDMPFQSSLGSSGWNRWKGIMQVNICVPKDSGTDALDARYNKIYRVFKRGYIAKRIRILSVGRTSARTSEDYCSQSVSISWEADLENQEQ